MQQLFPFAHATHPDWRYAVPLVVAQLQAQRRKPEFAANASLGVVYFTEAFVPFAEELQAELAAHTGVTQWVGCSSIGICANGVEYFEEPALAVMLLDLPPEHFTVFNGAAPLKQVSDATSTAHTALVHADPRTHDLDELIAELAARTATGYLFGGLACGRERVVEVASGLGRTGLANMGGAIYQGGLSGVAFTREVGMVSRVTQGCQPLGASRQITRVKDNVVYALDDEPALPLLLAELGVDVKAARENMRIAVPHLRGALVGLTPARPSSADATGLPQRRGQFGAETVVRHLVGIDPHNDGIVIADTPEQGMQLAFCERNVDAARRDLMRICAEIREELEPENLSDEHAAAILKNGDEPHPARKIRGAIYASCTGRGGPHFGNDASSSAELKIVQHALGDVPLVGFFAAGEIARGNLYGYTGVLTVFT